GPHRLELREGEGEALLDLRVARADRQELDLGVRAHPLVVGGLLLELDRALAQARDLVLERRGFLREAFGANEVLAPARLDRADVRLELRDPAQARRVGLGGRALGVDARVLELPLEELGAKRLLGERGAKHGLLRLEDAGPLLLYGRRA